MAEFSTKNVVLAACLFALNAMMLRAWELQPKPASTRVEREVRDLDALVLAALRGGGRHLTSPVYEDLRIPGPGLLIVVEPPDPEVNDVDQSFLQHPFNSSALEILPVVVAWPWCAQFTCK